MIKKAVLPVAGFGTRFLPASKATPKEMLPIIDKPLVQFAVEEAIDIGIEEIIFITSDDKFSIKPIFLPIFASTRVFQLELSLDSSPPPCLLYTSPSPRD